ncbi:imidazoleglycerol-phosphate dehydratase HisB [Candidatus Vidania fulgoroideorum]
MNKFYIKRVTNETNIKITINFNKNVNIKKIKTGIGFFDHLLQQTSFHGNFFLKIKSKGDLEVDNHHLVEDIGIALGKLFKKIFKKKTFRRYSFCYAPMEESLCRIVLDICNRPNLIFNTKKKEKIPNGFNMFNIFEFFKSFVNNSFTTIHLDCYGEDSHHKFESIFKCFGLIIKKALKIKDSINISTKSL